MLREQLLKQIRCKECQPLIEALIDCVETLEFYSQGGHPAMDMWKHKDLGYFTGKRAQKALTALEKLSGDV